MEKTTLQTRKLLGIVAELRKKCPWDRKQTHKTLIPYLLEEAYEAIEAIREGDAQSLKEELGDLLLQVVLHAEIASEKMGFGFEEIAQAIGEKMVRRHPHVFEGERTGSRKQHSQRWTELKQKEKPKRSLLEGTPRSMPALQLGQRYGEITSSVGFDWGNVNGVWDKLEEEVEELRREIKARKRNRARIAEELGDVLFTLSNLARHLGLNAEEVGRQACAKFRKRFEKVEKLVDLKAAPKVSITQWEQAWEKAKRPKRVNRPSPSSRR